MPAWSLHKNGRNAVKKMTIQTVETGYEREIEEDTENTKFKAHSTEKDGEKADQIRAECSQYSILH
jgi:hypothetical protein